MIPIKSVLSTFKVVTLMIIFISCAGAQQHKDTIIESKKITFSNLKGVSEIYIKQWASGIREGGHGTDVYILLSEEKSKTIVLDSIYFRNKKTKLVIKSNKKGTTYVGSFVQRNTPKDIILSNDLIKESKNKLPTKSLEIPFKLNLNDVVISYIFDSKIYYAKFENITEKQANFYPSAPPKQ